MRFGSADGIGLPASDERARASPDTNRVVVVDPGAPDDERLVLDALRKKRNLNDYSGDLIDPESVRECVARAEALLARTQQWLAAHRADLLQDNE